MGNFEYIISSLPFLTTDYKYVEGQGFSQVMQEIRENLSEKDASALDFLLRGFQASELTPEFYTQALEHPQPFIREYFHFDLNLRNAKVRYLNQALGRPLETDVVTLTEEEVEFEEKTAVETALALGDLLSREKELDEIAWAKIGALETFHYFDLTAVLAYVAKLHIVDRWLILDEAKGRELFKQLVSEVRGTFKGVEYTEK
ncbi:MAG: DUF2764 family protein [Bacteroidales bacterium]|nr:DUF2764 family protein [Bacteroidales bacterium]